MFKQILFFAYGVFSNLVFFGTFLYAIGFIGNFGVPTTLDGETSGSFWINLFINAGLLTLFAVQHSLKAFVSRLPARRGGKFRFHFYR